MNLKKISDCEHLQYEKCKEFNRKNPNCTNACPLYEPTSPKPLIMKELAAGAKQVQALKTYLKEKGGKTQ